MCIRFDDIDTPWADLMDSINDVYTNKRTHTPTHSTSKEARDPRGWVEVNLDLEMHRHHTRAYPTLLIGDKIE